MHKLKVSTRLTFLVSVLLLLLVAIGSLGLYGLGTSNDAQRTMFEDRTVPVGQLGEIRSLLLRNRLAPKMTDHEERLVKAFSEHRGAVVQEGLLPAVAALRANDLHQVGILTEQKIRTLFSPVEKDIDALVEL